MERLKIHKFHHFIIHAILLIIYEVHRICKINNLDLIIRVHHVQLLAPWSFILAFLDWALGKLKILTYFRLSYQSEILIGINVLLFLI